jgi:hypothetical protein
MTEIAQKGPVLPTMGETKQVVAGISNETKTQNSLSSIAKKLEETANKGAKIHSELLQKNVFSFLSSRKGGDTLKKNRDFLMSLLEGIGPVKISELSVWENSKAFATRSFKTPESISLSSDKRKAEVVFSDKTEVNQLLTLGWLKETTITYLQDDKCKATFPLLAIKTIEFK